MHEGYGKNIAFMFFVAGKFLKKTTFLFFFPSLIEGRFHHSCPW